MNTRPTLFADSCCYPLAESPMWHPRQQMLYWRGCNGEIYRKALSDHPDPDDFTCYRLNIGMIGSMVFTSSDALLLFAEHGRIWRWIPGNEPVLLSDFNKELFNDVLCDSHCRIYCGMLAPNFFDRANRGKHGSFWRLDPNGDFVCLDANISPTPNGIRIGPNGDCLYLAVTDDNCIYRYAYDVQTGALSHRRVFAEDCSPDGIAVDAEGNLWVACCRENGGLLCYDPSGRLIHTVDLPVSRVMSVAFGGADRKTLFVATGSDYSGHKPHEGGIFALPVQIPGAAEYCCKDPSSGVSCPITPSVQ